MLGEILCFSVLLSRNSTVDRETERKMDVGSIQRICSVTGKRWILALTQVGFLIGSRSNTINRFSQKHLCYSLFITDRTQVSPGHLIRIIHIVGCSDVSLNSSVASIHVLAFTLGWSSVASSVDQVSHGFPLGTQPLENREPSLLLMV